MSCILYRLNEAINIGKSTGVGKKNKKQQLIKSMIILAYRCSECDAILSQFQHTYSELLKNQCAKCGKIPK